MPKINPIVVEAEQAITRRVEPKCRHFGFCGGCSLQHLDYAAQAEWRRGEVAAKMDRELGAGRFPPLQAALMEEPWGHRSKMEFTFGQDGERLVLGLHQKDRFDRIVDIERCEIAAPDVSRLIAGIRDFAGRSTFASYGQRNRSGFWRYAVVRVSRSTGQMMLLLITATGPREPLERMAQQLQREVPALKSFYWGITDKVSDVAQPDRLERIAGDELLEDSVGSVRYRFGPMVFLQPNHALVGKAYETIRENARLTGRETVYELYCGIGLIGLTLAGSAARVIGVESEPQNVELAERNAALNGVSNVSFLRGKTEDLLKGRALFRAAPAPPDVIVVDPPRAGLHKEVYAPLLASGAPRLLYMSCNPASLARDLTVLMGPGGYRAEAAYLFDFFPHTVHAEVLAVLVRSS